MKKLQKPVLYVLLASMLMVWVPSHVGAESCKMEFRKNSKVAFVCDKSYKLDVAPFVQDNTMLFLPVRFFFERFGAVIVWTNKRANISYDDHKVEIIPNSNVLNIDGRTMDLAEKPAIKNNRLFLSVSDITELSKQMTLASGSSIKSDSVSIGIDSTKIKYPWHDFTRPIMNGDGKTLTFSKVMSEPDTKVVIVQIWHTGCAGCIDVLKLFQKLWTQYQGKGLKIVSINTDGPGYEDGRAERLENAGVTYQVVLDETYSLKPDWYDPIFPNYYLLVPGDKYIRIFQERWDESANAILEKTVGDLCSGN